MLRTNYKKKFGNFFINNLRSVYDLHSYLFKALAFIGLFHIFAIYPLLGEGFYIIYFKKTNIKWIQL